MKQALHIKNLTKKYKDFTLDHISLDLPYGMILGLIGENGSGKSTLINSILNIVKADYDEVHILGQDLKSQEKEIKKEIAVIFNDSHYGENLTPLFIGKKGTNNDARTRQLQRSAACQEEGLVRPLLGTRGRFCASLYGQRRL